MRVFIAVMENTLDPEWLEPGLQGLAKPRMVDPLPRLGVGRQRAPGLGVEKNGGRVVGRNVVDRRGVFIFLVRLG